MKFEGNIFYIENCIGIIDEVEVTATNGGGSENTGEIGSWIPVPEPSYPTGGGGGISTTGSSSNGYPNSKANLGSNDFVTQIKNVLQDFWCIYIGQLSGDIDRDYKSGEFFDYSKVGLNFDNISSMRQVYSYKNSKYHFAFPDDPSATFNSISKYFPGNSLAYQYKDYNGITTTKYDGTPISHPYGIRIFGYNGGKTNIATLLFSSRSEWQSWWNNMKIPQKNGSCKY